LKPEAWPRRAEIAEGIRFPGDHSRLPFVNLPAGRDGERLDDRPVKGFDRHPDLGGRGFDEGDLVLAQDQHGKVTAELARLGDRRLVEVSANGQIDAGPVGQLGPAGALIGRPAPAGA